MPAASNTSERLTLHQCPKFTGSGFESLTKLARLKTLAISECPIDDDACKHIGSFKALEEVRLIRAKITDDGLRELANQPALGLLTLEGTPVTGSAFGAKGWSKLRDVNAAGTDFNDSGMEAVAGLPMLESLQADSSKITDDGITHLKACEEAKRATPERNEDQRYGRSRARKDLEALRVLDLSNTDFTGSCFAEFPTRWVSTS